MNTHLVNAQESQHSVAKNIAVQSMAKNESPPQLLDQRPIAIAQRKLQELADNSPQAQEINSLRNLSSNSRQAQQLAQLHALADRHTPSPQHSIQRKANNTGLPDQLKSGIENLSGFSMDDVKVHYNSDRPAQLQAHAYAQGTDIHLAPGQERHLPHEAWHVVQQKQGRVKPTLQLREKVNMNDDQRLEREADMMGARAVTAGGTVHSGYPEYLFDIVPDDQIPKKINGKVAQRWPTGNMVLDTVIWGIVIAAFIYFMLPTKKTKKLTTAPAEKQDSTEDVMDDRQKATAKKEIEARPALMERVQAITTDSPTSEQAERLTEEPEFQEVARRVVRPEPDPTTGQEEEIEELQRIVPNQALVPIQNPETRLSTTFQIGSGVIYGGFKAFSNSKEIFILFEGPNIILRESDAANFALMIESWQAHMEAAKPLLEGEWGGTMEDSRAMIKQGQSVNATRIFREKSSEALAGRTLAKLALSTGQVRINIKTLKKHLLAMQAELEEHSLVAIPRQTILIGEILDILGDLEGMQRANVSVPNVIGGGTQRQTLQGSLLGFRDNASRALQEVRAQEARIAARQARREAHEARELELARTKAAANRMQVFVPGRAAAAEEDKIGEPELRRLNELEQQFNLITANGNIDPAIKRDAIAERRKIVAEREKLRGAATAEREAGEAVVREATAILDAAEQSLVALNQRVEAFMARTGTEASLTYNGQSFDLIPNGDGGPQKTYGRLGDDVPDIFNTCIGRGWLQIGKTNVYGVKNKDLGYEVRVPNADLRNARPVLPENLRYYARPQERVTLNDITYCIFRHRTIVHR